MPKRKLRVVTVSFVDDNFGDNLIRTAFQALLEVALADHGIASDEVEIARIALKNIDEDLLRSADAIFFAGGGLFGLSYLGFHPHVDRITAIASSRGIPVVFSSMGLNNMGAPDGGTDSITEIISRDCVKRISVRENLALFQRAAQATELEVRSVADPAVWTKYVYGMADVVSDGTLGINVVRGGLFAANDRPWGLTAEMGYLTDVRARAHDQGITAQFFTNGSLDDNNTLRYFARERELPHASVLLPQTTREVVQAIASRSMLASIRMHSAIIAYSFGIPTVALAWNDKLPHFYEAIGHPERLLPVGEWTAERALAVLTEAEATADDDGPYREYLMSTYAFIHEAVGGVVVGGAPATSSPASFSQVATALAQRSSAIDEDEFDLRIKMEKAERAYLNRFVSLRENESEIRQLHQRLDAAEHASQVAVSKAVEGTSVAPADRKAP